MTDPHRPEDVAAYNENALEELAWAIAASVGQFKLLLARCNYTRLRSRLVERLRKDSQALFPGRMPVPPVPRR